MSKVFTMYHKTVPVIRFAVNEKGYVTDIIEVVNEKHAPVQFLENGKLSGRDNHYALMNRLTRWKEQRNIPGSRKNLDLTLSALKMKSSDELAEKAFYMSLSDCYWIATQDMGNEWNSLNFFDNPFSDDVGKLLLGSAVDSRVINARSPNNTSQGQLEKAWKIQKTERILIKGGSGTVQQEPFNEVLASEIFRRLEVPHVKYDLFLHARKHYCICDNMLGKNQELVSAGELCEDLKDFHSRSVIYEDFKKRCSDSSVRYDEIMAGKMFLVDFLIANTDRHLNNFGFIRDADTLEWKGNAPAFDSGNAMFKDCTVYELKEILDGVKGFDSAKPFDSIHEKQLELFPLEKVFKSLNLAELNGIDSYYRSVLAKTSYTERISEERKDLLCRILAQRLEYIKNMALQL